MLLYRMWCDGLVGHQEMHHETSEDGPFHGGQHRWQLTGDSQISDSISPEAGRRGQPMGNDSNPDAAAHE